MTEHVSRFWSETERYHELVEEYERNIETTHPDYITSDRLCSFARWCKWHRTAVTYRDYRGPRTLNI